MKKLLTKDNQYHFAISVAAIIFACFIAFMLNVSNASFVLPEPIAQSKIWLWISYPYHFLVNILPKDSFIFDMLSAELVSFLVVVFIYLSILFAFLPVSQRRNLSDEPKWIITNLITYPLAAFFMFLFGYVFIVIPFSFLISLFT